jgi:phosphatidylglycerophosphate synthase
MTTTAESSKPSRTDHTGAAVGEREAGPDPFAAVVKSDDGFVATFLSAPVANWMLRRIVHTGITPNAVTAASAACAVLASLSFAVAERPVLWLGALLLQLAFVLDCLDGQLARYRGQTTALGSWFDLITDRLADLVIFAGIAVGCVRSTGTTAPFLWSYAALGIVFYRHFDSMLLERLLGDDYRSLLRDPLQSRTDAAKVRVIADASATREGRWGAFGRLLERLAPKGTHEPSRVVYWAKRALRFDGGERYLLISLLAVADGLEWAFPVIVVWGGIVHPLTTARRWMLFGRE